MVPGLTKADALGLIAAIDTESLESVLADALRKVLEVDGYHGDWAGLIGLAAQRNCWSEDRRRLLIGSAPDALAGLATELSERRSL